MLMTAKEKVQKTLAEKAAAFIKLSSLALFANEGWTPSPDETRYFLSFDSDLQCDKFRENVYIESEDHSDIPLGTVFFKSEEVGEEVLEGLTDADLNALFANEYEGVTVQDGVAYLELDVETLGYCAQALIDQKGTVTSNDVVAALRNAGYWATHSFVDPTLYNFANSKGWVVIRSKGYNEYFLKMPENVQKVQFTPGDVEAQIKQILQFLNSTGIGSIIRI